MSNKVEKIIKNVVRGDLGSESSNMIFIFHIDKVFINYLCNDEMLPLWYHVKFSAICYLKVHWFSHILLKILV